MENNMKMAKHFSTESPYMYNKQNKTYYVSFSSPPQVNG